MCISDSYKLSLSFQFNIHSSGTIKTHSYVNSLYDEDKKCFLVNMQLLMLDALLPEKTVFECVLKDVSTGVVKKRAIKYNPSWYHTHINIINFVSGNAMFSQYRV